jgi:hypothetical protein
MLRITEMTSVHSLKCMCKRKLICFNHDEMNRTQSKKSKTLEIVSTIISAAEFKLATSISSMIRSLCFFNLRDIFRF